VIGTGLIGGSLGMALRRSGWHVAGVDTDPGVVESAVSLGAIDEIGDDPDADLVVVATPVHRSAAIIRDVLADPRRPSTTVVTDVGSVKASVLAAVDHPRFIGGHPMAGSEQVGIDGADPDLFVGATWVLTPSTTSDPIAYARLRSVVTGLGATVVALTADRHDALVAVVSHVPHLTAVTLMDLAASLAEEHGSLLRLAGSGFRDMTRVAAGRPSIWLDICADNAPAIVFTLDRLIDGLQAMRSRVAARDGASLGEILDRAALARRGLATHVPPTAGLTEVRVPVPDRAGVLAEITTLPADLGINVVDFEIVHSLEGAWGVLVLVVGSSDAATLSAALQERGYHPTSVSIETPV
jgi:prephenate dehydrogenase